jgi:uncharacterized protein YdhG (YjbR/CyaY superfamily)
MEIKPSTKFASVDAYHAAFPDNVRARLDEIRAIIKQSAPKSEELLSYNMPAYKLNSVLVYYGGGKNHIGFYPTPGPITAFADVLTGYKTSKGAIQFPLDKPIPKKLVKDIVKFRMAEDEENAKKKPAKKTKK